MVYSPCSLHIMLCWIIPILPISPSLLSTRSFPLFGDSVAPAKMIVFSWKILLDRFTSRENMLKKKVIFDLIDIVKTIFHVFTTYILVSSVWYKICKWLEWQITLSRNPNFIFESFLSLGDRVKSRDCFTMIWHVMVWTLWKPRNNIIFFSYVINVK